MYSVIVCAYNEEKTIFDCLESLRTSLEGHGSDVEVLVIDNNSSDHTLRQAHKARELFHDFCPLKIYTIRHVPLAISRNTGVQLCSGEIVFFIDADALVDKGWFVAMKETVESPANQDKLVFSGQVKNYSKSNSDFSNLYYQMITAPSQSISGSNLIGANMGFKKKSLLQVNGFSRLTEKRGDETYVFQKMKDHFGENIEVYSKDAIIFNEFPNSIQRMLEIIATEANAYATILFDRKSKWQETVIRFSLAQAWTLALISLFYAPKLALIFIGVRLLIRFRFFILSFSSCLQDSWAFAIYSLIQNSFNTLIFDYHFAVSILKLVLKIVHLEHRPGEFETSELIDTNLQSEIGQFSAWPLG